MHYNPEDQTSHLHCCESYKSKQFLYRNALMDAVEAAAKRSAELGPKE
jgi:hypothetical protein